MTPKQVQRARRALGLSQSQFAKRLGVHVVTVKKWEAGMQGMRATAERLIRLLVEHEMPARRKARKPRRGGR